MRTSGTLRLSGYEAERQRGACMTNLHREKRKHRYQSHLPVTQAGVANDPPRTQAPGHLTEGCCYLCQLYRQDLNLHVPSNTEVFPQLHTAFQQINSKT